MGIAQNNPTKLLAYDTFLQSAGALTAKTLPLGGTWAGAGDSTDFNVVEGAVEPSEGAARRTALSDADLNTGRYAIAGSEEPVTAKVSVHLSTYEPFVGHKEKFRHGVFLRYKDPENWLAAYVRDRNALSGYHLTVAKRVGGGEIVPLGTEALSASGFAEFSETIALQVGADGTWQAWAYPGAEPAPLLSGQDSALATEGALAKGKVGILDAYTSGILAKTRNYDNFTVLQGEEANRVLFSGRTCRHTSDGFSRQDPTGKFEGLASQVRGANLYLDPGINRLVVSMRRNDAEAEAVPDVTDRHTAEVLVTERWLAPR